MKTIGYFCFVLHTQNYTVTMNVSHHFPLCTLAGLLTGLLLQRPKPSQTQEPLLVVVLVWVPFCQAWSILISLHGYSLDSLRTRTVAGPTWHTDERLSKDRAHPKPSHPHGLRKERRHKQQQELQEGGFQSPGDCFRTDSSGLRPRSCPQEGPFQLEPHSIISLSHAHSSQAYGGALWKPGPPVSYLLPDVFHLLLQQLVPLG